MAKLVVLKLGNGDFQQGFPVTLQIGDEGKRPSTEIAGRLPPAPDIPEYYDDWLYSYHRLGLPLRLEAPAADVTNIAPFQECLTAASVLSNSLKDWLNSMEFREVRESLLEKIMPSDEVRVILQADEFLQRLPWHRWQFFERYPKAEIALSPHAYDRLDKSVSAKNKVRILAILGDSSGIDIESDRAVLEQLPNAEIDFLVEPQRREINNQLWEQSWDILFFAGHSRSEGETGRIYINQTDSLMIGELRNGLKKAIQRGLQLAIFNSCDGLGLARELADLQIPQVIVMREPVPDRVAQDFLKYFLSKFSTGESFYLAVREARERLQGLEDEFPCASWLPVICQHPAEVPPTWQELGGVSSAPSLTNPLSSPDSTPIQKAKSFSIPWRLIQGKPNYLWQLIISLILSLAAVFAVLEVRQAIQSNQEPILSSTSTEEITPNWKLYQYPPERIKLRYPDTWELQEINDELIGDLARFIPLLDINLAKEELLVRVENLSETLTLEKYATLAIEELQRNNKEVNIMDSGSYTVGNRKGYMIIYTLKEGSYTLNKLEVATLKNQKAYIISYKAPESNYFKFLPTVKAMIKSFEIGDIE
ncbi:MAG: hypothetical protein Fur006_30860 [Coleofasciculaceae cyanobacterium]